MGALRSALLGIGSAVIIRQYQQMTDTLIQMRNRLKLVTRGQQELTAVTNELFQVANDTRSSFEATAEVYTRLAIASRQLGVTQQRMLNFTKGLNQAIILSGASAQEARNGLIQFAQGMASNRLAGEELRAVLEQLPLIADVIAEEFGVVRGALRDLAAQGKINAEDILRAFSPEKLREINKQFAQTQPTISQALNQAENELIRYVGITNDSIGVSDLLVGAIQHLAKNFEFYGDVILTGVVAGGMATVISLTHSLTAAIAANPIGALAVVLTTATAALVAFSDEIKVGTGNVATLRDVGVEFIQEWGGRLMNFLRLVRDEIGKFLKFVGLMDADVSLSLREVLMALAKWSDQFGGIFLGTYRAAKTVWDRLPETVVSTTKQFVNDTLDALEFLSDSITAIFMGIGRTFSAFGTQLKTALINVNEAIRQLRAGELEKAKDFLGQATLSITQGTKGLFKNFGSNIADEFGKLRDNDVLPRMEVEFENEFERIGTAAASSFTKGFYAVRGAQDLVQGAFSRAQLRGARRNNRPEASTDLGTDVAGGRPGSDTTEQVEFQNLVENLEKQLETRRETIGAVGKQREIEEAYLKTQGRLLRKNIDLKGEDNKERRETIRSLARQKVAVSTQIELIERLRGSSEAASFQLEQLAKLQAQGIGTGTQGQFLKRNLELAELEQKKDVMSGFERGFLRLQNQIQDFASLSEETLVGAFNSAEDALVEFVQSGEFNFSKLVDSILADLTRLLARQAIFQVLGLASGGGGFLGSLAGGALSALGGGGGGAQARANGGPVKQGNPYLVGEKGPEIFTPKQSGDITPNGGGQQQSPQVNVINVTDPDEVTAAINSRDGEEAILNVLRRNRNAARSNMGLG